MKQWLLLGLMVLYLLASKRGAVFAHAELVQAVPEPGAILSQAPSEIRLTFAEEITAVSTIALFGQNFRAIAVNTYVDTQDPKQLVADIPELSPGVYTVQWTAVSLDNHPLSGSYSFQYTKWLVFPTTAVLALGIAGAFVAGIWAYWRKQQRATPTLNKPRR